MSVDCCFLPRPPCCLAAPVSVEAADLVALTQPWEEREGKREVLLVSPGGLARHWPDMHSPRRFTDVDARSVAPGQSVRMQLLSQD